MSQEAVTIQEVVISPVAVVKAVGKLTSQSAIFSDWLVLCSVTLYIWNPRPRF